MNKNAMKVTALALSAAMLVSAGAVGVYAQKEEKPEEPKTAAAKTKTAAPAAAAKDETVYILAGADGKTKKVIVSSWLENTGKADTIGDLSGLTDIENVKGEQDYTTAQDGSMVWNAAGEDIYYQGTTQQEVPVSMNIRYTLNGKPITPAELAGKSGKVTIRFDYRNNEFREVKVDGRQQKIYVPFTMLTGTVLDTQVFRNVTVENGKAENFGNQIAVLGVAMPGMQENLNISKDKLEIPTYVQITADVENFRMGPTLTAATTALFRSLDTENLSADGLIEQAEKLTSGVTQLMDGSDQLYAGLNKLLEQSGALVTGVNQLNDGAAKLQDGVGALSNGASQLQEGAAKLSGGLNTLNENSAALTDGARQVFNTLLSTATAQLNAKLQAAGQEAVPALTIGNYTDVLNGVIARLDQNAVYETALQMVTATVDSEENHAAIVAGVTAAVRNGPDGASGVRAKAEAQVRAGARQKAELAVGSMALGMTPEEYMAAKEAGTITEEQQNAFNGAVAASQELISAQLAAQEPQILELIEKATDTAMASEEVQAIINKGIADTRAKKIAEAMASEQVQSQIQTAAEGVKEVYALKTSLDSYSSFYQGVKTYTGGVAAAAKGAGDLKTGAGTLNDGMGTLTGGVNSLADGIKTMNGKMPALVNGITQLRDGSGALKDGIKKLMDEGVQKLANLAEEDLEDLTERLSATVDAAKDYRSFSGIQDKTEGSVKFIYKTDSVETED